MVCPSGLQVDPNTRTCLKKLVGVYQTNLNAPNLLFNGISVAQNQYIQTQSQIKYPSLSSCPLSTPFFDGFKCISCKTPYPQFSMVHKTCASCPSGTTYSSTSFACMSAHGGVATSSPNLGKMYSSIF